MYQLLKVFVLVIVFMLSHAAAEFYLGIRDSIMIAHSFKGAIVFEPKSE